MDVTETNQLQHLRKKVLAQSRQQALGQVNALMVLAFRKIEQHGFSEAYFNLSFWPQLAPLLADYDESTLKAAFLQFVQH